MYVLVVQLLHYLLLLNGSESYNLYMVLYPRNTIQLSYISSRCIALYTVLYSLIYHHIKHHINITAYRFNIYIVDEYYYNNNNNYYSSSFYLYLWLRLCMAIYIRVSIIYINTHNNKVCNTYIIKTYLLPFFIP